MENKTGNTGTKAYFREQGTAKSKKYFWGIYGNTRKILLGTREHDPPPGRPLACSRRSDSKQRRDSTGRVTGNSTIAPLYYLNAWNRLEGPQLVWPGGRISSFLVT